jgi:hypothetical protein
MRTFARQTLLLFAFALGAPAAAETKAGVEIVDFGLYAIGPRTHIADPTHLSGQQWRATHVRLLEQTDIVPGQLGRCFGLHFRVTDSRLAGKALTLRIRHPHLTEPSGRSGSETNRTITASVAGQQEGNFFSFDYSWEIAEGDWTFEIVHEGRVLAAKKFRVIVSMF